MQLLYTTLIAFAVFSASVRAEIVIGVAGPLSGQNAVFGEQMVRGAQAAADKINAAGGINGELLTVVSADDACDARRAVAVAQTFIAKDVRLVVGHFCSSTSLAVAEAYGKTDIMMISPTASHPKLTNQNRWNVLRLAARDDAQADVASARIASQVSNAKIAVITDNSPGMAVLTARMPAVARITIKPGDKSFAETVNAVRASGANVIYFACGGAEAGVIAGELQDAGIILPLYGPDSLLVDVYWERGGIAAEGTQVSFAADPMSSSKAQGVVSALTAAGFDPTGAVLPSYAAVEIFSAAASAKSVNDGKAMADWLKSGANVDTVLGAITFDTKGDVTPARLDWYVWSQGSYARQSSSN
jgi:branched-chain amino acid transport system substrate-binding protein